MVFEGRKGSTKEEVICQVRARVWKRPGDVLEGGMYKRPLGPCEKCGAHKGVRFLEHHITYEHDIDKAVLCESCHNRITRLNTKVARLRSYTKLTSAERHYVYNWFARSECVLRRVTDKVCISLIKEMGAEIG